MQRNSSGAWRLTLLVDNRLPICFPRDFPIEFRGLNELQATLLMETAHVGIASSEKQETDPAIL
jgi:hypothetical protein